MPESTKIDVNALLRKAGISPEAADATVVVDGLLQEWRRRAAKRELSIRALNDFGLAIDQAQLDVLIVVYGAEANSTPADGEVMVSSVAERLGIDPSRASRLVSEMVEAGYTRRAVSQADARRTIIELTDAGRAVVEAIRAYKFLVMGDFLSRWSPEQLAMFVPMMQEFAAWQAHSEHSSGKFSADIAELSKKIARFSPAKTA